MWSGSTTCCAATSPSQVSRAQLASWDSRMMVEKPVRKSEFCISCTMPASRAWITCRVMGSADAVFASLDSGCAIRPTPSP